MRILGNFFPQLLMPDQKFMGIFNLKKYFFRFRVDGLHSETYKILGGLNRTDLDVKDK